MKTARDWWLMIGGGTLTAVLVFVLILWVQHLRDDEVLLHQVIVPVLQYNVQQGKLLAMPAPQAAPPAPTQPIIKPPDPAPPTPAAKKP